MAITTEFVGKLGGVTPEIATVNAGQSMTRVSDKITVAGPTAITVAADQTGAQIYVLNNGSGDPQYGAYLGAVVSTGDWWVYADTTYSQSAAHVYWAVIPL